LLAVAACVSAHAVSIMPPAWNPNPSTTAPCGNGANPQATSINWNIGTTQTITWQVLALDGAGAVTVLIDTTGGQTFTQGTSPSMTLTGTIPPGVGTYNFTSTVPNVKCTGTGGTCTLQLKSSSGWYSCATVAIVDPNNPPATKAPTLPPNCQPAFGLTFCTMMNGQNVYLPNGQISAISLDHAVNSAYTQYLANPKVFHNPYDTNCQGWFKKFICGLNFQPCGAAYGTGGCQQACLNTNSFCQVDNSHLTLYQCGNYTNTVSDLTGPCNGAASMTVSAIVLFASALLMLVM